ncbi:MAG: hypothetical protein Q8P11_03725 [bacterium]|nr:hypothetical protein [bacterium]
MKAKKTALVGDSSVPLAHEEGTRIIFATVHDIVFSATESPQPGITVVLESQDTDNDQLLCVRTNEAGKLPISHDLPDGAYMMTMLYTDRVERQPIFIGQPKGGKPKGSVRKLA